MAAAKDMAMDRPRLEPAGYFRRINLLPHQLTRDITPTADAIVLCHLGVPRIDPDSWQLEIAGMVGKPRTIGFEELRALPRHTVETVHQCAGSPLAPAEPTRRICNVRWTGVRLAEILKGCELSPDARYLWSTGADYGEFSGVKIDNFVKDLPIERLKEDVLIACEINGDPLPPENGFPARLVVPGFYGTNSVKWLKRIEAASRRSDSPFTTTWYNDPIRDQQGHDTGQTRPVWSIAPESLIVSPGPDATIPRDTEIEIWGRAWADKGIDRVEIAFGDDERWVAASLEPRNDRAWQRFSMRWAPGTAGAQTLRSRAYSADGEVQPASGQRNAIHSLTVHIA
jgi:DMSO/TMAO reductase YedYZ molybdopterin-dependent catalytic subunit